MKFILDPAEIQKLTPMPASVTKLVRLTANPDSNIHEIGRVIEYDEALTSNVLRWANSAWSGASSQITTIRESVIRLGTAQLLKLAVGYRFSEAIKSTVIKFPGIEKKLWHHSVASAMVVEHLANYTDKTISPISFTAALIHDIGKLLIYRHCHENLINEMWQFIAAGEEAVEVESGILGTNHAIVGGEIAWFWKFPDELIEAIEQHHDLSPQSNEMIAVVQLANFIANCQGELTEKGQNLPDHVVSQFNLDLDKLERLRAGVMDKLDETLEMWSG